MQNNDELIQRLSASMQALNVRIVRLASALHVALDDPSAVAGLMSGRRSHPLVNERRRAKPDLVALNISADRRQAHRYEELRGLLGLRYHLETTCRNDTGLAVTCSAITLAEEHLIRQSFNPGTEGLGLDDFLMSHQILGLL